WRPRCRHGRVERHSIGSRSTSFRSRRRLGAESSFPRKRFTAENAESAEEEGREEKGTALLFLCALCVLCGECVPRCWAGRFGRLPLPQGERLPPSPRPPIPAEAHGGRVWSRQKFRSRLGVCLLDLRPEPEKGRKRPGELRCRLK